MIRTGGDDVVRSNRQLFTLSEVETVQEYFIHVQKSKRVLTRRNIRNSLFNFLSKGSLNKQDGTNPAKILFRVCVFSNLEAKMFLNEIRKNVVKVMWKVWIVRNRLCRCNK